MESIPGIFSILVAAIGWHYLFYSRAAHKLGGIEEQSINRARIRLRRIGGAAMILLGLAFAVGYYGANVHEPTATFIVCWGVVALLLPTILGIGVADLRLTRKLHRRLRRHQLHHLRNGPEESSGESS